MSSRMLENGWPSDSPTAAQVIEFLAQIKSGRITKDRLQDFLRGRSIGTVGDLFHVIVDYSQSLSDKIKAGNYDWFDSNITAEHFPISASDIAKGKEELDFVLFHPNRNISSEEAVKEMEKRGFRLLNPAETLDFGSTHPDKQREFPIVSLGSTWLNPDGHRQVFVLYRSSSERKLGLGYWDGCWYSFWRFLAVGK